MGSLQEMAPQLATLFGPDVLRVLVAIIVLFVGWLVARIGAWAVKKSLEKTTIDNRIAKWVLGDQKGEGSRSGSARSSTTFFCSSRSFSFSTH